MNVEVPKSFQENFERLRQQLLIELEEIVTNPKVNLDVSISTYEKLQRGEKIPWNIGLLDLSARIAQDLRIDPIQAEAIQRELFLDY